MIVLNPVMSRSKISWKKQLLEANKVECLWVRVRGKANKADVMVGVYYRPPNQDKEVDKIFYKEQGEVSQSLALILTGDFNLPDFCCKYNTTELKQSRRFLEYENNFLTQVVSEPTTDSAFSPLKFTGPFACEQRTCG